ncbi:MAG TPA: dihydropteroate synthase [Candidatus Aquilonibacter sp.]
MRLRGRNFGWGERTYLMAIVNVTPDSFSGDGKTQIDAAIEYAVKQWNAGADMVDVGGESTRPGHQPVDETTELARVVPVIAGVRARLRDAIISVDTTKPAIVRAAHAAGADIVNSVWGAPDDLLALAAEFDMPIAAAHNQRGTHYDRDVVDAVVDSLRDCAERAMLCGIGPERIMLDPGIGFGKTPNHNIRLLHNLDRITALGFPTMLGTSRKSTIGKLTGREPNERIYGTAATTALGIAKGVDIVRVHDVAQNRDVISVSDAIVRDWRPSGWTG